ncbi:protein son of sevenless-like [Anoplolepis gracilipes]|uniref:protein son of sevenless-like n=1 Tax=Anoplolepis gracilipes TaxID=354296 RepID=UPI003B9E21E0
MTDTNCDEDETEVLEMDMFYQDNYTEDPQSSLDSIISQDYKKFVSDLISDEQDYIHDLHIIIKIFREEIAKLTQDKNELETLFSNITDIPEVTNTLVGSLKEVMEIREKKQMFIVGSCFEELAEAEEFDVYIKYARNINSPASQEVLKNLLSRPEANSVLRMSGYSIREAVKYYLPKLLLQPIWHCFQYFDYIKIFKKRTQSKEDSETLERVQELLKPLQTELIQYVASLSKKSRVLPMQIKTRRKMALEKIRELQQTVDGWNQLNIGHCCSEFIREDTLEKANGRKLTERKALLFDGLLKLCKPISSTRINVNVAVGVDSHQTHEKLRLKEKFFIRKVDIIDREDTEDLKNAFEIAPRDHFNSVILVAKSVEDKNNWMADLVMLNIKSMLERTLKNILLEDEERKHPLRLPPPDLYKFAEQDSRDNIVLKGINNDSYPLKGATLIKLIERLTYHIYVSPTFLRIFLTTYRNFCSPQELLTLLIERFDIPDPSLVYGKEEKNSVCKTTKKDWERYRKEFCQPVQIRVLNVLRYWINHHFYDFERDKNLLERLQLFLNNSKYMRKCVESLLKIVQRKCEPSEQRLITFSFERSFPPIETHLQIPENYEEYGIITIHPTELARQLTLLEFELYRVVKPSELVGCVWTKKDKEMTSPNVMKIIKHTTNFTRWLEKIIVEAQNFEERVAIVSRIIEIMMVLEDLNNFNGVLAILSAIDSASVFRLNFTFQSLQYRLMRALQEAQKLKNNHFRNYKMKLLSINPPCVPFLGMYLTNILHIEEGNPDYLPGSSKLINFSKLQKVTEIICKIQQYQNQPYCLSVEPKIRKYIENICPFDINTPNDDIDTYLYKKSLEIEPRECKEPIQFPRKWSEINLKSPGIKTRTLNMKSLRSFLMSCRTVAKFESGLSRVISYGSYYDEFGNALLGNYFIGTPTSLQISKSNTLPSLSPESNRKENSCNESLQHIRQLQDAAILSPGEVVSSYLNAHPYSLDSVQPPDVVSTDAVFSDFKNLLIEISSATDMMRRKLHDIELEYYKLDYLIQLNDPERILDQFKKIFDQFAVAIDDISGGYFSLKRDFCNLESKCITLKNLL